MRHVLLPVLLAGAWACSPQAARPAQSPEAASSAPSPEWKQVEPSKQKVPLLPEPAAVPPAEASCSVFVERKVDGCAASVDARAELAAALATADDARDQRLACLESAPELPSGALRALRAELAPLGCADVLVLPVLEKRSPDVARSVEDTLLALGLAGRLSRLVRQAPELPVPFDKLRFQDFFQAKLKPWIVAQAAAIHDLSLAGARLGPYAKGIVAVEAGLADMRFVSVVRQVALPKEINDDAELREAYYASLDEALEPRKARGRDAALVGLRELAHEGVVQDPRVQRARALLSQVYSGRRIDALDGLLLPALPAPPATLAARLPTFYASLLVAEAPIDAAQLRALMEHGIPRATLERIDRKTLDAPTKLLLTRALIDRGRLYFRAEDFAAAAELGSAEPRHEQALYHALAVALREGPRDSSELLLRGPSLPNGTARVAELDALAEQKTPVSALAAYDAAYLLGLVPPTNDAAFWEALAARFEKAARGLRGAEQKRAKEQSKAARDTAKAVRAQK